MNSHKNALLTAAGRLRLVLAVQAGLAVAEVARDFRVSARTVWKWVARYRAEGVDGLRDRPSRPHRFPRQLPRARRRQILRARKRRWSSLQIAQVYQLPLSTVVTVLRRWGLNRLSRLEPRRPVVRYEHPMPGDLVHVDIKKLGRIDGIGHRITGDRRHRARGVGWEFVHVCLDDCSRLAYAEVLTDEQSVTVAGFLRRALTWFARRGVVAQRVLSDNGSAYRSRLVAATCQALALVHRFTRPYTPRTNGKAERFIQTLLREWAYAIAYPSSAHRTAALARWLHYYNWHRPHSALHRQPPISRVVAPDDLLRLHT